MAINIKNLPTVVEPNKEDYVIIEQTAGTKKVTIDELTKTGTVVHYGENTDVITLQKPEMVEKVNNMENNISTLSIKATEIDSKIDTKVSEITSQLDNIIQLYPSNDVTGITDTLNIKNAFENYKNVTFSKGTYYVNENINIQPLGNIFEGRQINYNGSVIKAINKPSSIFTIKSDVFPNEARNYIIDNVIFDGEVADSFILLESSNFHCNKITNISSTLAAKGNSLIKLVNTHNLYQGGLNTLKHIRSYNLIKHTIEFKVNDGANNLFDDLIVEDIVSTYLGDNYQENGDNTPNINDGACIFLNENCYISMSKIKRLFFAGYGNIINCSGGNNIITNSTIENLYSEPKGTQSFGIRGVNLINTTVNQLRLYLVKGSSVTTYPRCLYTTIINSDIKQCYINEENGNTNGYYIEELGLSKNNKYDFIGDNKNRIIFIDDSSIIRNGYNDKYLYNNIGNNITAWSSSGNYIFKTIKKSQLQDSLKIKIIGETDGSVNNNFNISLDNNILCMLNNVEASGLFEIEAIIYKISESNMLILSKSIVNGVITHKSYGTPLTGTVILNDNINIIANVNNASYIRILNISIENNHII